MLLFRYLSPTFSERTCNAICNVVSTAPTRQPFCGRRTSTATGTKLPGGVDVDGLCRPARLMRVSRKGWRKGSSVRGDITVIVRFQNSRGLLFPNHRAVGLDSRKKAEKTMVSIKSEGPRSVIHNNRQVGARENRLMERRRQAYQTVRYTWHGIPFSRIQCALRRDGYRRQIVTKLSGPGTFDEGQFPQKASRHYVGNLKVPVIRYGESR